MVPNFNPAWGLAHRLSGLTLREGWVVGDRIELPEEHTGGYSSVQYLVERDSKQAFLKVLDYRRAFESEDPARELHLTTEAFLFERDLLRTCESGGLNKIVRALDTGSHKDDRWELPAEYIIFELADHGDLRQYLSQAEEIESAWRLRCLHQVAVGLQQLHAAGIAHQDAKPSNTLLFLDTAKLGDLGRASLRDGGSPTDGIPIAGQISYAPPELRYHHLRPNWAERRVACDLYLLGNLVLVMFTGTSLMPQILARLPEDHRPDRWEGTYEEIEPEIRRITNEVLDLARSDFPQNARDELQTLVRYLTDANPSLRGHPKNRLGASNPYSLERFVSILDRLATRAELGIQGTSDARRAG